MNNHIKRERLSVLLMILSVSIVESRGRATSYFRLVPFRLALEDDTYFIKGWVLLLT
jgi:hypothetical protein